MSSVFCHANYSIRIIPFLFFCPHFVIHNLPSAFFRPYFDILIKSSSFFHPLILICHMPSAIRCAFYRDPLYFVVCRMIQQLTIDYVDYQGFSSVPPPSVEKALRTRLLVCISLDISLFKLLYSEVLLRELKVKITTTQMIIVHR